MCSERPALSFVLFTYVSFNYKLTLKYILFHLKNVHDFLGQGGLITDDNYSAKG